MISELRKQHGMTQLELAEKMGSDIGLAFQIRDDILDVTGVQELIGKPVGSDERNSKQTYVSLYGIDKAQKAVEALTDEALRIFDSLRFRNPFLRELILELTGREK